jgi:hypothetical protein
MSDRRFAIDRQRARGRQSPARSSDRRGAMPELIVPIGSWFEAWVRDLSAVPPEQSGGWPHGMQRTVLETLSDASSEQFLNPLVAIHLRKWGQAKFGPSPTGDLPGWFWVRSEWGKVDISYGIAPKAFSGGLQGWDAARHRGNTGDRGQLEVKVCYSHLYAGRMLKLGSQLLMRREAHQASGSDRPAQAYHGLVWLFDDGRVRGELAEAAILTEATAAGLTCRTGFVRVVRNASLGQLWPSLGGEHYACSLWMALMELQTPESALTQSPQLLVGEYGPA